MSKYSTMEKMINEIQTLMSKMQHGQLNAEELETMVSSTRELHERALILRYKAYEQKVFGTPVETETVAPVIEPIEEVIEPVVEPIAEIVAEPVVESVIEPVNTEVVADDAIFGFDLFAANDETKKDAFQVGEIVTETPVTVAETPILVEETPEVITEYIPAQEIIETPVVEAIVETPEPIVESENPISTSPVVEEVIVETIAESPVVPTSTPNVLKHFQVINESTAAFLHPKINTLTTAFGLNERLQCVRELFNGSSESFVQTLEKVDQQASFDAAKAFLSEIALQNNWNLEANLVKEFMLKIERRFI